MTELDATMKTFSGYQWNYFTSMRVGPARKRVEDFLESIKWPGLLKYASDRRNGMDCVLLPDIGLGGRHLVRILEFTDGVRWVARLKLPLHSTSIPEQTESTKRMALQALREYYVMSLIREKTDIPIPFVHAIEERGFPEVVQQSFMLMDCLEGNVGMDLGMELPLQHKQNFIQALAEIHVKLATIKLPKIGTIIGLNEDGSIQQGPIPGIGGPFDTAAEFFKAWADTVEFGSTEDMIRRGCGNLTDEVISGVASFPKSIHELSYRLSAYNDGPFPLCHGDFGHNNIIVDDDYNVLGVIDWETAYASPWEIFGDLPLTLSITPPAMDAPWNYDEHGNPTDPELAQRFLDQQSYLEAIREAEIKLGLDGDVSLFKVLTDTKRRQIMTAIRLFRDGKMGLYARLVREFS